MINTVPESIKAELIRGILESWDPCRFRPYPMYYDYEAEVLAQSIWKDSAVDTTWKNVKEVIDKKLEFEKKTYRVDEENAKRVAGEMIDAVKNMSLPEG